MIHLRLVVDTAIVTVVLDDLRTEPGVAHVIHLVGAAVEPAGDLVLCDVVREAANDVIERLQDHGIHHGGAITIEAIETVVSDAAAAAEVSAPGFGTDALIWEQVEARARDDATLTPSFVVFLVVAALIAGVGILLDAPILIVGAMVVGPEYGPLSSMCVNVVRGRLRGALRAAGTLAAGLSVAALVTYAAMLAFRVVDLAPARYDVTERQLTAFISHPDGMAAVVAVLAGIVGMLSLTEARSGALIGVLVSVTTIPAVANVGVGAAYREWDEVWGAALQLVVNVVALVIAGVVTLAVQERATTRRRGRRGRSAAGATWRRSSGPPSPPPGR